MKDKGRLSAGNFVTVIQKLTFGRLAVDQHSILAQVLDVVFLVLQAHFGLGAGNVGVVENDFALCGSSQHK